MIFSRYDERIHVGKYVHHNTIMLKINEKNNYTKVVFTADIISFRYRMRDDYRG